MNSSIDTSASTPSRRHRRRVLGVVKSSTGAGVRRDAEENRHKVLAAAHELMTEHGLGVSHDQIAREAGVAVGTVYRRFPDKGALVSALFADQVERVVILAEEASEIDDPWQAIAGFLTDTLAVQEHSRGLRELILGSPTGRDLASHARSRIAPVVEKLVRRGHAAGVLRADVTEQDLTLIPIMIGPVIHAARRLDPTLWRRSLAIVLDGIHIGTSHPLPGTSPSGTALAEIMESGPTGVGQLS